MEIMKTALAGLGAATIICWLLKPLLRRKERRRRETESQPNRPKISTSDLVLVIMGVSILLFVLKMIQLFETYMAVPDTLITCFFAVCGGEAGILGWIKNTKTRNQERKWQLEDMKRMEEENPPQQTHY